MNTDEEMYRENILDHFNHPHNYGILAPASLQHRELNPLCGDEIEMAVVVAEGKVADARFQGQGCAISVAAASLLTDHIKGKPVAEIKKMGSQTVLGLLGISIGATRLKCALLPLKTIQGCLEMEGI